MPNFASITLIGHVGQNPESKDTSAGPVAKFSVAVNQKQKGKEDKAEFFRCSAFGRLGEIIMQYVHKGDAIMIVGTPKKEVFQKKDGTWDASIEVIVRDMTMLSAKKDSNYSDADAYAPRPTPGRTERTQARPAQSRTPAPAGDFDEFGDDCPF